jgi:hypothetical protein
MFTGDANGKASSILILLAGWMVPVNKVSFFFSHAKLLTCTQGNSHYDEDRYF